MEQRTLDRLVRFDEKSRNFPVTAVIKQTKPRSYTWRCSSWLDQGREGACTGFAVSHEAAARPVEVKNIDNALAYKVYKRAQQLDIWPGENYSGSSVLAAMKAGKELGWYDEYRWAFGVDDLALAVSRKGPAVLGVNWYEGMFQTSRSGYISVSGRKAGGHAILCHGFNVKGGYFKLHNSWGKSWGINGECKITYEDMDRLLREQGEACIPVKRKKITNHFTLII